ncbi:MAG: hypothetical protein RLZZ127_2832 [Planctomycetota bacterium]|jgi:HEAT repeat protein
MTPRFAIVAALAALAALAGCGAPPPGPAEQAVAEQTTLLEHHDGAIRAKAAAALGDLVPAGSGTAALVAALGDRQASVREAAARSLGRWRAAPAADPLAALVADAEPAVRAAALAALAACAPDRAAEPAGRALADRDPVVRLAAARVLSAAGRPGVAALAAAVSSGGPGAVAALDGLARSADPQAAAALVAALGSADAEIRRSAVAAIAEARAEAAVPALVALLAKPADRAGAMAALARIGSTAAATALVAELAAPDAAVVADHVRGLVATARPALLAATGDGPGPDAVAALLLVEPEGIPADTWLRLLARVAQPGPVLARLVPGASASAATAILRDRLAQAPSAALIAAVGTVAAPGDALAGRLAALAQAAGTAEDRRAAALKALVRIGDPAALPLLRPRLGSDDARVLAETISGLAALRDPELAPRLESWLRERTHPRLWHIAGVGLPALAALDPERALPVLRSWALEPHPMVDHREKAVALAAGLGTPGLAIAAAALAEPGLDADWRRRRVAPLLHKAGTAAVPALLPLLDGPAAADEDRADPGWWAAELIAAAGDPGPVLARGAGGGPRVRARLARALAMPGQPAALAAFAGFLADADPAVRRTAAGLAGSLRLPVAPALSAARAAESDPKVQAALDDAIARVKGP